MAEKWNNLSKEDVSEIKEVYPKLDLKPGIIFFPKTDSQLDTYYSHYLKTVHFKLFQASENNPLRAIFKNHHDFTTTIHIMPIPTEQTLPSELLEINHGDCIQELSLVVNYQVEQLGNRPHINRKRYKKDADESIKRKNGQRGKDNPDTKRRPKRCQICLDNNCARPSLCRGSGGRKFHKCVCCVQMSSSDSIM